MPRNRYPRQYPAPSVKDFDELDRRRAEREQRPPVAPEGELPEMFVDAEAGRWSGDDVIPVTERHMSGGLSDAPSGKPQATSSKPFRTR